MRGRKPSQNSEYYLPTNQYLYAVRHALLFDDWRAEIKALENQSRAIRYDKERVQTTPDYNATEVAAFEILEIQKKVDKIERALAEACEGLDDYTVECIRLAVTKGYTYTQLTTGRHRMPLNHIAFGKIKHKFYYILYQLL